MNRPQTPSTITRPLESVTIPKAGPGTFSVRDGQGREYLRVPSDRDAEFTVGGALGSHTVFHLDRDGRVLDSASFRVDCETEIDDDGGRFKRLLDILYYTMFTWWQGGGGINSIRLNGKLYKYYVSWLRDHVHALKGMKYFDPDIKTGIELYADSQREDGMIWDKCKEWPIPAQSYKTVQWRREQFEYGDFWREIPEYPTRAWQRVPVENDVEFLFIEGLYYTWKACGDDTWMAGLLDNAIRAVGYSTSDPYRWSEKFRLLKRGYTIDTWDFQTQDDIRRSGTTMRVLLDKTEFNIFHGDNTGMAISCRYLAEMLRAAGREGEAGKFDELADALKRRLDELSWNGEFYTHMIPENPNAERDLGDTPTDRQVTISNAYALNRRIDHEQCVAILRSYQRIREEMPESSPGEWYNCYPPFEKGFRFMWDYMNGGVSPICAGELAHGAFQNGFEPYGVDILTRILDLADRHDGYLPGCFKGKVETSPPPTCFTVIDLEKSATGSIRKPEGLGVSSLPEGPVTLLDVDFDLGKKALTLTSDRPQVQVPVSGACRSLYLLHTIDTGTGADCLVGDLTVEYEDGTHVKQYVHANKQVEAALFPLPEVLYGAPVRKGGYRLGWHGENVDGRDTGLFAYGWDNPHPEKAIKTLRVTAAEGAPDWWIAAITLSDQPVRFPPHDIDHGIPDMWGAAAVVYALLEGLGGIVDDGRAYDRVRLSPRWAAANARHVTACAKYPASGGYVRYCYTYDADEEEVALVLTGSAEQTDLEILLPAGRDVASVRLNGEPIDVRIRDVESGRYLALGSLEGGVHHLNIRLNRKAEK